MAKFPCAPFRTPAHSVDERIQRKDRMYWQIEDAADFKAQFERRHGVAAFEKTGCLRIHTTFTGKRLSCQRPFSSPDGKLSIRNSKVHQLSAIR